MKKYIQVLGKVFESYLLFNLQYIKDEYLLDTRKNRIGNPKNNFYVSGGDSEIIKKFEKLNDLSVFLDKNTTTEEVDKVSVKNYFSYSNILNSYQEIEKKKKQLGREPEITFEEFKNLLPENQNSNSHFSISAKLGNAKNKNINIAHWDSGKEFIWKILFSETQFFGYIFEWNDEISILWEFNQNKINSLDISENEKKPVKILQKIFYGAPGTGKSHKIETILEDIPEDQKERITFHPEYDYSCFVGGYKPSSDKNADGTTGDIKYEFVPQVFTKIYIDAWKNPNKDYFLVIEEINRGNCAEIFGDLFQLLDRNSNYSISPSKELKDHLENKLTDPEEKQGIENGKMKLPANLHVLASMNTSDQSLFPMDSAFKRRWSWEYIPICYDDIPENESFKYIVNIDEITYFEWIDFIKNVNRFIKNNPNLGMDKCIGNYFIKSETKTITLNEFVNKVIFYLWNDVFKDEDSSESIFEKGTCYEDFFPLNTNAKDQILKILKRINIEPTIV
ncbi:McrB family protein [Flavobacterium sp. LM4]|uniref:McrB family protein n=1 Tax=Flavobacterium sp. LM4 TaxID=1938609 RepID=UPI0009948540|nr:AAA family ATPase [Flavobacterium sp. LM4]OOV19724.1 hypothetical protein BXU10_08810 [Flavobacterium sp. LM4]